MDNKPHKVFGVNVSTIVITLWLILLVLVPGDAMSFRQEQNLEAMAEQAEAYYPGNPDSSIILADQVISIIREKGINSPLEEDMLDQKGWSLRRKREYEQAEQFLLESIAVSKRKGNQEQLASTYLRLGFMFRGIGRFDEALEAYKNSERIRTELNDERGLASVFNNMGILYRAMGDQEKAFESYTKSIEIREKLGDQEFLSSAVMNLGVWMAIERRFDEALVYFERYRNIQEELKDTSNLVMVTTNIGNVYSDQGIYEKALEYYHQSVDLLEQSSEKDEGNRAQILFNIGYLYGKREYYEEAISSTKEALEIYRKFKGKDDIAQSYKNIGQFFDELGKQDSALWYYDRSLELYRELGNQNDIARVVMNIGVIHNKEEAPELALSYFQEAERILAETQREVSLPGLYNNIGASYFRLRQYQTAIDYYKRCLEYATQASDLEVQKQASFDLAEVYGVIGDYENGYKYQLMYDTYKDSLFNMERTRAIEELITQYETDKKEAEIRILTAEQAENEALIKQRNAENQTLFIGVISLITAVLGISGWYVYSNRKKKVIAEQKEALFKSEIDSLLERQQVESVTAMLEGQEKERKRLAAELHDRLGSVMSLVKLYFSSLDEDIKETKPELYQSFAEGNKFLDDAFNEVRALITEMKEGRSTGLGLQKDLEQLLDKIEKVGVRVNSRIELDESLDALVEMNVYRIIQEALSNALKYSKATNIELDLVSNGSLKLKIRDNGVGFDPETVNDRIKDREGYGLSNMENRVKVLGGTFKLDARSGSGVMIDVDIPNEELNQEPEGSV